MTDTEVKSTELAATGRAASCNLACFKFSLPRHVVAMLVVLNLLSSFVAAQSTDERLTTTQIPRAGELRIPQADMLQNVATVPESQTMRDVEQVLNRRGNAIFRDTAISEVIYTLSQQWGINIVAGAEVSGTVSGVFRDASLREILDALLTVNGYGYRQNGANLLVMRLDQIGPNNPNFRAETLLLPPTISGEAVDQVVTALRVFSSGNGGQIQAIPSTNTLMVYDTPDKILQMQQMLQNLSGMRSGRNAGPVAQSGATNLPFTLGMVSSGAEILKLRPQFVPVSEIAKAVELAIGTSGTYVTIEGEQVVLVSGPPEILRRAESVFQQVDQPRAQVRITAYIYDVSLGELERLGIDWSNQIMSQSVDSNGIPMRQIRADAGLVNRNPATGLVGAATTVGSNAAGGAAGGTAGAATATANGGQWVFRTLSNNFELNTVLQALDETKGAKLLADPHVTVVDRQKAEINIVTKIPIQQLTQTQQGGSIGTTAFEKAGIKMDVTPRIASDGTVEMQVVPEFSVLTGFNSTGQPIIDARRASTTVRVAHQQTLVIGGLRQKTAVETVRGIPGLMNWKYIGRLFQTHNTEMRESELIVFIQPEIVNYEWTGLQREANAIATQKAQLSTIPTACPGPWVPNCRDPHCPHHCPRPRPNPGEYDDGYVMPASVPQALMQQPSSMSVYRPSSPASSEAVQDMPLPNPNVQPTQPIQLEEDVLSTEPRMPTVPQNTEEIPQARINSSTRKGLIVPAKIITN